MAAEPLPYSDPEATPTSIGDDLNEKADQWPDRSDLRKDVLYLLAARVAIESEPGRPILDEESSDALLDLAAEIHERHQGDGFYIKIADSLIDIVYRAGTPQAESLTSPNVALFRPTQKFGLQKL